MALRLSGLQNFALPRRPDKAYAAIRQRPHTFAGWRCAYPAYKISHFPVGRIRRKPPSGNFFCIHQTGMLLAYIYPVTTKSARA